MLNRQPKSTNRASGGKTAISTVSPPPFFHGMRLKSADRRTVMGSVSEDAGQSQALLLGAVDSDVVAGIRMAHEAGGRVVPQNPLDATIGILRAAAADDHAVMLGKTTAEAAALVQRDPGCSYEESGQGKLCVRPCRSR